MKKIVALVLVACLCLALAMVASAEGSVYYLNFKPEQDAQWQELAKIYTEQTGVPVTVVTAASGNYETTLMSEIEKSDPPTLFQVNGPVGLANWKDYCYDLKDADITKHLTSDSFALKEGDTVYALGYPGGGAATVTTGKVTDPENDDYLAPMIESTAQVISGNSGGALINDEGKVVGITVSSHSGGVPSYSVPIRYLNSLIGDGTAYSPGEYNRNHKPDASRCYSKHYPVPDFGTVTGVTLLGTIREGTTTTYYYDREEVEAGDKILLRYYAALGENTFYQFTGGSFTSSSTYPYSVKLYETSYDGIPAISVVVSSNSFASIGGLPQTADFLLQEFVHYA